MSRGGKNMMKNKIMKSILNGGILAVIAALGITVYQIGTRPVQDPEEDYPEYARLTQESTFNDGGTEGISQDAANTTSKSSMKTDKNGSTDPAVSGNSIAGKNKETASGITKTDGTASVNSSTVTADTGNTENAADTTRQVSAAGLTTQNLDFTENSLMEWPVRGTVLVDYNMDETVYFPTLDQYKVSPAVAIQAVEDAPVYAAADGQVLSIEQDACTGTTVTMELGNGYQAIYGQLKDLTVAEGDTVKEGDVIGNIDSPTKYYSVEGPNLYFQMKKDGETIDPFDYLS